MNNRIANVCENICRGKVSYTKQRKTTKLANYTLTNNTLKLKGYGTKKELTRN